MRRALPALVVTALAVWLLASFKTHPAAIGVATSRPAATPAPPARHASRPAASSRPAPSSRTITGDAVETRYGAVQVRITLRGRRITSVRTLEMTADNPRSVFIDQQAEPLLRQETLQAHSASIDVISGATYTSEGYIESLQSALDRARA